MSQQENQIDRDLTNSSHFQHFDRRQFISLLSLATLGLLAEDLILSATASANDDNPNVRIQVKNARGGKIC